MTFGELKTHFNALLNRSDITTTLTALFINMGVSRFQRDLRVPGMEKKVSTTIGSGDTGIDVPNDYIQAYQINCDALPVANIPLAKFSELSANSGQPVYWTRKLSQIVFWPTPPTASVVDLYYYGEFDDFTTDGSTSLLSAAMADLVLYGALSYASDYYIDERAQAFEARYEQIKQSIQDQAYSTDGESATQPAYVFGDD